MDLYTILLFVAVGAVLLRNVIDKRDMKGDIIRLEERVTRHADRHLAYRQDQADFRERDKLEVGGYIQDVLNFLGVEYEYTKAARTLVKRARRGK